MNNGGITLFEVLTALALTSILAGTAVANFRTTRHQWQLEVATRQIALDLRAARVKAIASSTTHRLRFEAPGSRYDREISTANRIFIRDGETRDLPRGTTVTKCNGRNSAISFRPRGNAGSFGTITVANANGDTRDIVIDMAGRVRIRKR